MISKSADELDMYKQCFDHLPEDNNVFLQVLRVLEIVANNRSGLGEVMQDYAAQAHSQLTDIMIAGRNVAAALPSDDDLTVLHNANHVMKTIGKFLELTPAAMERNNAETIGKKDKISRSDVEQIYKTFCDAVETKLLLTYETECGETAEHLLAQADQSVAH